MIQEIVALFHWLPGRFFALNIRKQMGNIWPIFDMSSAIRVMGKITVNQPILPPIFPT